MRLSIRGKTCPRQPMTVESIVPNIGIAVKSREDIVQLLGALLPDEYVPFTETREYHWNVTGPRFQKLHEFFKTLYTQLDLIVDDVAERLTQLGGKTVSTLEKFGTLTRSRENAGQYLDANKKLSNLRNDHEAVIRGLRIDVDACADRYHDIGTNDFLVGLMEQHEKIAWMIRAHIEGGS